MSRRNLLLLLASCVIAYACYVRAEQNPYARYVAAGYSVIDRWALVDADDQGLFEGAMRGMIKSLRQSGDEHSAFVDQRQRGNFRENLSQEFGGVGVRIRMLGDPKLPTVIGPPEPGTPAFRADIRSGDRIVAIDGRPTDSMEMLAVLQSMRGPAGSEIVLSVLHASEVEPEEVALVREIITEESIYGDIRNEDGTWVFHYPDKPDIGYLRITKFGDKTEAELTRVLAQLTKDGVQWLIIDVRDNYGGALDAAVGISDLFLRAGLPIVSTRGRDGETRDRFVSTGRGNYSKIHLVVLLNHNSASASEILAACLQDHGRAVVVGQRSYGKGTVQRLMRIESGRSLLKLTSATYWRPSGRNIHRMPGAGEDEAWGVKPNTGYEVVLDEEEYLQWRHYRRLRDALGDKLDDPLAAEISKQDGRLPESFKDRALQRAVEYLESLRG